MLLISICGSPNWARLIYFLLGERHPHRLSFGAFAEEDFGNAGLQTQGTEGEALWATAARASAGSGVSGLSPNGAGTWGEGIHLVGCPVTEDRLCAKPPPSTDSLFSCK